MGILTLPMVLTHHVLHQVLTKCPVITFHRAICLRIVDRSLNFAVPILSQRCITIADPKRLPWSLRSRRDGPSMGIHLSNRVFVRVEAYSSLTGTATTSRVRKSPVTTTFLYPFLLVGEISVMSTATVWNRVGGCHWTIFA
jgi:hypothetical protein